ncbi:hypothetical protein MUB16_15270 [Priestia sp. OVL9]|nr:hypothetical protein [Priestia sp. OVL9]
MHRAKQRLEKDGEPFSTDSFWNEKERKELSELFYKTLEAQDPALLIQALPSLKVSFKNQRILRRALSAWLHSRITCDKEDIYEHDSICN